MLTEIFLSFMISSGIGLVVICVRLLYKSKCKLFQLCCLKIERDVEVESQADLVVDLARRLSITPLPHPAVHQQQPYPLDAKNSQSFDANLRDNEILRYENIYNKNLPKKLNLEMTKKSLSQAITSEDIEAGVVAAVQSIVNV